MAIFLKSEEALLPHVLLERDIRGAGTLPRINANHVGQDVYGATAKVI
jgi:hypothetical protein